MGYKITAFRGQNQNKPSIRRTNAFKFASKRAKRKKFLRGIHKNDYKVKKSFKKNEKKQSSA